MGGDGMGVTPSGPVGVNRGVRARVREAGKALEGESRMTDKQMIRPLLYNFTIIIIIFFIF